MRLRELPGVIVKRQTRSQRRSAIRTLCDMHTYQRPHRSKGEAAFIARYIATLPGVSVDVDGNYLLRIGTAPILWSAHLDTVARSDERQTVRIDRGILALSDRSYQTSACLGADDTAGVFLLREMILAGTPGLYIFHRGEERGGIGSRALVRDRPDTVDGIQHAIAFDRRGTTSIITWQSGGLCCSDTFALALADRLNAGNPGFAFEPDETGVYTDTAEYTGLIPECTNVSVGYEGAHSPRETLDVDFILALREALIGFDASDLPVARTPGDDGYGAAGPYADDWIEADWRDDRDDRSVYLDRQYADAQTALRAWFQRFKS
jgi:hypothetical protein